VILGNPPYSGHSKNKGAWITASIDGYKYTVETDEDGKEFNKPLGERNPKWLNDDYVKFIRFAQLKMDAVEEGVVGIITNHSWLDNPTFRGMRQSLMRSFNQIHVLDLHGNAKKKEVAPDGSKDENIFDIEQGVAISIFVKKPGLERSVWRGDLWGKRLEKYRTGAEKTRANMSWRALQPVAPFFLFTPSDAAVTEEYRVGWRLPEIYIVNVLGFQTHRDEFAISFTELEMRKKLSEFVDLRLPDDDLVKRYGLISNGGWLLPQVRSALRARKGFSPQLVSYRPFDDRLSEYSGLIMDRPRRELIDHVVGKTNLVLGVGRAGNAVPERPWELVLVSSTPVDANVFRRGGINLFPTHLYLNNEANENFAPAFRSFIDAQYDGNHYEAKEILGYIYAILHAPTYRRRYAEFLRIDFPRIPFTDKREDFETLSRLGAELIEAHLLKDFPRRGLADYHGRGDNSVEKPRYVEAEQSVFINDKQSFAPVPKKVWEFHIGGYQVLDKYLKSRKGRMLSLDEINHVAAVADVLAFTIEQMEKIDGAWRRAFPDRG
jgi:predicted helicase